MADFTQIIEFDRQLLLALNGSNSLFLDSLMITLTHAATWIPLYLALVITIIKNNENVQQILLILSFCGLCVLVAGGFNDMFIKPSVARWRPGRDPEIGMLIDTVNGYRGGSYGFFSSHAANTFSLCVFLSLLIRQRALTIWLVVWSLLNCYTRIYLGVHYPGDIVFGLLWGFIVGCGMYLAFRFFYRRISKKQGFISSQYTSTGYALGDIDMVIGVLILTFVYAIIRACFVIA